MQVSETTWSETEQKAAKKAFDLAYERETLALIKEFREKANSIDEVKEIWVLHDFLSAKRHEIDGKYEYRYSVLIFVFARLLKEGWLHLDELEGLDKDKRVKAAALSRM